MNLWTLGNYTSAGCADFCWLPSPLQFKWREPEETGGRAILYYVLEMVPPPMGWEGAPNGEVRVLGYRVGMRVQDSRGCKCMGWVLLRC